MFRKTTAPCRAPHSGLACTGKRALIAAMLTGALAFSSGAAFAVDNTNTFELEGNAVQDAAPPPDDWETLYGGGGSATAFTGIVSDKNGTDDYFTGGGSKTPNLIGDWQYKLAPPSGPPDKDNITHAYAANYVVGGEQVVYFGADLFATNGDAELAFWFFQQAVTKLPVSGSTGSFDGEHTLGDVYVAVKFSNGGTQADIAVYEWDPSCTKPPGGSPPPAGDCAADNLRVVIPLGPATCDGSGGIACAISNPDSSEVSPWPYTPKSGPANEFPPTAFFEGGLNIYQVFGQNLCFSSFMATTGASTSFTSTAKDFALGDFDVCSVAASKTCVNDSEADDTPTAITYNVRGCAINNGGSDINVTSLLNSIGGAVNYEPGDLAWYVPGQVDDGGGYRDFNAATDCGNAVLLPQAVDNGSVVADLSTQDLAPGQALVYEFSETTAANGPSDTVTIDAQGTDGSPIDASTADATCPLRTFSASLSVNKQCAADLEDAGDTVVVKIFVQGQVCNTGEVALTGLSLADDTDMPASGDVSFTLDPDGVHEDPDTTLAAGACVAYEGSYYPSSIPVGNICPFTDQATATALAPVNSAYGEGTGCTLVGGSIECSADSNSATCNLRALDEDNSCATGPLSPLP